jgi:hypothetical protein
MLSEIKAGSRTAAAAVRQRAAENRRVRRGAFIKVGEVRWWRLVIVILVVIVILATGATRTN